MKEYYWNDTLMSLNFLLQTEKATTSNTMNSYGEDVIEIKNLINLFFRLSYQCKENVEKDSHEHYFITIAYHAYLGLPYNLRAIYILWIKGYYLEATVVFRHILEVFAALRYFCNHKNEIKRHLGVNTPKKRVLFKTMFEENAPGFYKYYGQPYSDIAHGGASASLFRVKYSSPANGIVIAGEFNPSKSAMVSVSTIMVSCGYLNYISVFFPSIKSKLSSTIDKRIQDMLEHIENKYLKKADNDFVNKLSPLITK